MLKADGAQTALKKSNQNRIGIKLLNGGREALVTTVKNSLGYVIGYCESRVVNERGKTAENGDFVRIENIWIHELWRNSVVLPTLIKKVVNHQVHEDCRFVYWEIMKDSNGKKIIDDYYSEPTTRKLSKLYDKNKLVNKILGGIKCFVNCSD